MKTKTLFLSLALIATFAVAGNAMAATDHKGRLCEVPPDRGIYSETDMTLVGCNKADDVAKARAESDARVANQLPIITPGTVVSDGNGRFDICPLFFGKLNCVIVDQTLKSTGQNYGILSPMELRALQLYFPGLRIGQGF